MSRNYFDGDADCYCPHCNADDADIADLGSGEQPAVMAWNYQQARIDTLVEALEKAQRYIEELREWNAGLAQESCERQQLISELEPISAAAEKLVRCKGRYHSEQNYRALAALFGVTTPDLPPLEHENVHYADAAEMEIAALRQRIAELESRTVKLPDLRQIVSGDRYVWSDGVYNYSQDVKVALAAAGIKVEAE
ncbi:TPA: ead/Ea22-like family protein [Klebsiella pneumoniae]|nr:ead/Ea22-like family protein [Klebsiella pneumoniae]HBQ2724053.1 ead/Ea22-like family protein [Klebsiella pneumoniae]HBQ2731060.1 ead/Ea22-like family protein [Klebsiella pneumoniae]HBQ2740353.1 ead/Ea22-like family protein [Klebsiella pneumoniae]HBQ2745829.1 ead/Ea22-like family protein [Klebsiella pneumoniae]